MKTTANDLESSPDNEKQTAGAAAQADDNPALQESLDKCSRTIVQLDAAVREELRGKPEKLAEWDEIMRDFGDDLEPFFKEAEEAKLQAEINEYLKQISAEVNSLASLDPVELQTNTEVEETLSRNFAKWQELDAVMRLRCRDYPDKLARWEEEIMKPIGMFEAILEAGRETENAKPEN